jgi:3-deoxy-D-manno-octulosonic acid (KDO) 8-phosphate synthase
MVRVGCAAWCCCRRQWRRLVSVMKKEKQEIETENAVDWILVNSVLKAERSSMTEAFGEALGIHGDELLDEVEAMIDAKLATIRNELATMLTTQVAMVLQQQAQLKADVTTEMTTLRKDLGSDDNGVVHLPNPLRGRRAA